MEKDKIIDSWRQGFYPRKEELKDDGTVSIEGLRTPQLGAYHSVLAHWSTSSEHVLVVMPTGTGKTDTMISLLVGSLMDRLLIIVPTDALRYQIGARFETLGILRKLKPTLLGKNAKNPVVTYINKNTKINTLEDIDEIFLKSNVVISTAAKFRAIPEDLMSRIVRYSSHLFFDEAHHTEATKTWKKIQNSFRSKPAVLFTATPYRNDHKLIHSPIVYNYPLSRAQEEGYFSKINGVPIYEWDDDSHDLSIATKSVEILRRDLKKYPHILMARTLTITRAEEVFKIYNSHFPDLNPILITSKLSKAKRDQALQNLLSGNNSIVVCVDMLGEGFDLPQLKIGAFHDFRNNITTALQLIGRYTRTSINLGPSSFVYNAARASTNQEVQQLISGDKNWNQLIPNISESKISAQKDLFEFVQSFETETPFPFQNVRTSFSVVMYQSKDKEWYPEFYLDGFKQEPDYVEQYLNKTGDVLIIVTSRKKKLDWILSDSFQDTESHIYVLKWEPRDNLLLIHSSKTGNDYYKSLAKAVLGEEPVLISGEKVFRIFARYESIILKDIGLSELMGKDRTYISHMGKNPGKAIKKVDLIKKSKKKIQGTAYLEGMKSYIGVSAKGRIWSMKRTDIPEMISWAEKMASDVLNDDLSTESVLEGVVIAVEIDQLPNLRCFCMAWPEDIYSKDASLHEDDQTSFNILDTDLVIESQNENEIIFSLKLPNGKNTYSFKITEKGSYQISLITGKQLEINLNSRQDFLEYLNSNSPLLFFIDGSQLDGANYAEVFEKKVQFDSNRIFTDAFEGVNIRKESEGIDREFINSVQYYFIEKLIRENNDIIINDDHSGETADIVCVKSNDSEQNIEIELYHLKGSKEDKPGCRLDDLYVVCGQAQKNIRWLDNRLEFFNTLIAREQKLNKSGNFTRLRKGSLKDLQIVASKAKSLFTISAKVYVVQPGFSKESYLAKNNDKKDEVSRLLAVTESYLNLVNKADFFMIGNQ